MFTASILLFEVMMLSLRSGLYWQGGCWLDCKPEGPLFSAEFVCLCGCVCLIKVQISHRGTARHLFENLKKFSKITQFEFQNSGPSFFASVSPVYCNKNST